jgi:predicted Rdx family selenoprotein
VSATKDLLTQYQHVIEELRLVTGSKGVFDVRVDGDVIYSKHAEGRHAKPGEVLERFRAVVGPKVRPYGT